MPFDDFYLGDVVPFINREGLEVPPLLKFYAEGVAIVFEERRH